MRIADTSTKKKEISGIALAITCMLSKILTVKNFSSERKASYMTMPFHAKGGGGREELLMCAASSFVVD